MATHDIIRFVHRQVEIEVNGTLIDLKMTLDESGSAFFVKSKSEEVSSISCACAGIHSVQ